MLHDFILYPLFLWNVNECTYQNTEKRVWYTYNITSSPWKYVTRATHTPGLNNLFRKINKTTSIKSFSQVQHDYILLLSKRGPGFGVDWTSLCPGFLGGGFVGVIFLPKVLQKYRRFIFDEKIFFFTGHKHMWSVPNAFIVNISISDFLMTVFNCIFNYIYMRDRDWIFSDAYCVFNNFIAICTVAASVFSLSAMSINRYVHTCLGSLPFF